MKLLVKFYLLESTKVKSHYTRCYVAPVAQLVEHRLIKTQDLKIAEEKVLPL